jgi:hypothetical protein
LTTEKDSKIQPSLIGGGGIRVNMSVIY